MEKTVAEIDAAAEILECEVAEAPIIKRFHYKHKEAVPEEGTGEEYADVGGVKALRAFHILSSAAASLRKAEKFIRHYEELAGNACGIMDCIFSEIENIKAKRVLSKGLIEEYTRLLSEEQSNLDRIREEEQQSLQKITSIEESIDFEVKSCKGMVQEAKSKTSSCFRQSADLLNTTIRAQHRAKKICREVIASSEKVYSRIFKNGLEEYLLCDKLGDYLHELNRMREFIDSPGICERVKELEEDVYANLDKAE